MLRRQLAGAAGVAAALSAAALDVPVTVARSAPGVSGLHSRGGWLRSASAPAYVGRGAWSYFGDPRALYARGRTFVGWADDEGYTNVAALDRTRVVEHVRLGPRLRVDDHNNPSLNLQPGGRIVIFYSAHNGGHMFYRTSTRPYSVSAFSQPQTVGTNASGRWGYSYPNPLRVSGRLWLLFRGANWQPVFTISRPGGGWTPARTLVLGPVAQSPRPWMVLGPGNRNRPYAKYETDGKRIFATFTPGLIGDYPNAIYYAQFDLSGIRTAAGRWIARLGAAPAVTRLDLVRAFGGRPQWALDIAVDQQHRPVIVYERRGPRAEYWWARFDGRRWVNRLITRYADLAPSPRAVGGITLDHEDPSTVYLSRIVTSGQRHEVEVWTTRDEGRNWTRRAVTNTSKTDNLRPVSPRGLRDFKQVIWFAGRRITWTSFDTNILTEVLRPLWPSDAR